MTIARRALTPALFSIGLSLLSLPDWRALYGVFVLVCGAVIFWKARE